MDGWYYLLLSPESRPKAHNISNTYISEKREIINQLVRWDRTLRKTIGSKLQPSL